MDLSVRRTDVRNGREIAVGEQWVQDTSDLGLRGLVRCTAVSPARYVGIIRWVDVPLVQTAEHADFDDAWRATREQLASRVREAFGLRPE